MLVSQTRRVKQYVVNSACGQECWRVVLVVTNLKRSVLPKATPSQPFWLLVKLLHESRRQDVKRKKVRESHGNND